MVSSKPSNAAPCHLGPGIRRDERRRRAAVLAILLALGAAPALAKPVAVAVQDKGVNTRCAEEDNVYAVLAAPAVRSFQVTARQPAYGLKLRRNVYKADFRNCGFNGAHDFKFKPRPPVTLYEDAHVRVMGITYGGYWRPERVAVEVAGRKDGGFHLLQLFIKHGKDVQEAVVLHAADGYWRLRPLPLPQFGGSVYGSSFLVGPVEETTRPFVRIREVRIDPRAMAFHLIFVKGGAATLTVKQIDRTQLRMAVTLDPPVAGGPFVALRSMYVAPDNADTAQLQWKGADGAARTAPVVGFGQVTAMAVGFARPIPSRHNSAAPDLLFEGFEDGSAK
ncbi:MAG: hypothetical protein JWO72_2123 [Caulobacteraceae bacterium]|nr:hypothetical protein [Caulobacteraceae bacterium]